MEDPVREIESVIRGLTQTAPSVQRAVINQYFTPDAEFIHPFCRTPPTSNSRFYIHAIYRWYKIMSPTIELEVDSIAYDSSKMLLYVSIRQVFRIFIIPFYAAHVNLTTVLHLRRAADSQKYLICSQNDLYQTNEFMKFIAPFGLSVLVWLWQVLATLICTLCAFLGAPIAWIEDNRAHQPTSEAKRCNNGRA